MRIDHRRIGAGVVTSLEISPGWGIKSVRIDNRSGAWILVRPLDEYIAPFTSGWKRGLEPTQSRVIVSTWVTPPSGGIQAVYAATDYIDIEVGDGELNDSEGTQYDLVAKIAALQATTDSNTAQLTAIKTAVDAGKTATDLVRTAVDTNAANTTGVGTKVDTVKTSTDLLQTKIDALRGGYGAITPRYTSASILTGGVSAVYLGGTAGQSIVPLSVVLWWSIGTGTQQIPYSGVEVNIKSTSGYTIIGCTLSPEVMSFAYDFVPKAGSIVLTAGVGLTAQAFSPLGDVKNGIISSVMTYFLTPQDG